MAPDPMIWPQSLIKSGSGVPFKMRSARFLLAPDRSHNMSSHVFVANDEILHQTFPDPEATKFFLQKLQGSTNEIQAHALWPLDPPEVSYNAYHPDLEVRKVASDDGKCLQLSATNGDPVIT